MRAFVMVGKWSQVRASLEALAKLEREFPDLLGLCLGAELDLR
jgi:hypothetical protein